MSEDGLDAREQEGLEFLQKPLPFEVPTENDVTFWSLAEVQATQRESGLFKKAWTDNTDGYLMLAGSRLVYVTPWSRSAGRSTRARFRS